MPAALSRRAGERRQRIVPRRTGPVKEPTIVQQDLTGTLTGTTDAAEDRCMSDSSDGFCTIEEALAELRAGRMVVLVDDEYRENEGDLVIAAERATPEAINFMMHRACGMGCLAMSPAICDRLHLEPMAGATLDTKVTPLTQKFDARTGITTGISAFDRARTVQVVVDDRSTPADLVRGHGHMDGLRARDGG